MVTIGKPYQAIKDYEKDNYYIRDQVDNQIYGSLARELGIKTITNETYALLHQGKDGSGQPVIPAGATGEHRPGWDVCFTPDKSISVAYQFGTDQQRSDIMAAMQQSVRSTVEYIQDNLIQYRIKTKSGMQYHDTAEIVAYGFTHNLSRELDPNLHQHVVLFNITRDDKGQYRAITNEKLYHNRGLIMAHFEHTLTRELAARGYDAGLEGGYARLAGLDQTVLDTFSKRSEQVKDILDKMRESGTIQDETTLKNRLMLTTREGKRTVDHAANNERLTAELAGLGYTPQDIQRQVEAGRGVDTGISREVPAELVARALDIVTESSSVFCYQDVLKSSILLSRGGTTIAALERAIQSNPDLVHLERGGYRRHQTELYTTRMIQEAEINNLEAVRAPLLIDKRHMPDRAAIEAAREGRTFTPGQDRAYDRLTRSTRGIDIVQGDAGTGKTYMLASVATAYAAAGYRVVCLAPTGIAAEELHKSTGRESMTIDSYLIKGAQDTRERTLYIVDESSMVGTRKMQRLLEQINKAGNKVILTGDNKQLKPIEAGKDFLLMTKVKKATIEIKDNVRQKNAEMKLAAELMAKGEIDKAVGVLERKGAIREIAPDRMLSHVLHEYRRHGGSYAVITSYNDRRDEINRAIREQLKQDRMLTGEREIYTKRPVNLTAEDKIRAASYRIGYDIKLYEDIGDMKKGDMVRIDRVQGDRLTVSNIRTGKTATIDPRTDYDKYQIYENQIKEFAQGDRIQLLHNDHKHGHKNGQIGTIEKMEGNLWTVKLDHKSVLIDTSRYNYIDHAYAITYDKSQGQTIKLKSGALDMTNSRQLTMEKSYVGITRYCNDVQIYTDNKDRLIKGMKTEQDKQAVIEHDRRSERGMGL